MPIPDDFDARQFELFKLYDGCSVFGNLKKVEKPPFNNIDIFIKKVYVDSKNFEQHKVGGWVDCNNLEPDTSRDGIYEGSETYTDFMKKLMVYLDKNFDRKTENKDKEIKSGKRIAEMFVYVMKSIHAVSPKMTKPFMSGSISDQKGIGNLSNFQDGAAADPCVLREGFIVDSTKKAELRIAKPVGNGKGHKKGFGESMCRLVRGNGKVLAPSITVMSSGNDMIPEPKVRVIESEEKPVISFNAPNTLVINTLRPSSQILTEASPKDPAMKSRILPLLVIAGIDALPSVLAYEQIPGR